MPPISFSIGLLQTHVTIIKDKKVCGALADRSQGALLIVVKLGIRCALYMRTSAKLASRETESDFARRRLSEGFGGMDTSQWCAI
jgi:hypothetical protein